MQYFHQTDRTPYRLTREALSLSFLKFIVLLSSSVFLSPPGSLLLSLHSKYFPAIYYIAARAPLSVLLWPGRFYKEIIFPDISNLARPPPLPPTITLQSLVKLEFLQSIISLWLFPTLKAEGDSGGEKRKRIILSPSFTNITNNPGYFGL